MFAWITPSIWKKIIRNAFEPDVGEYGVAEAIDTWNQYFSEFTDYHAQIRPFVYTFTQNTNRSTLRIKLSSLLIQAIHSYAHTRELESPKTRPTVKNAVSTSDSFDADIFAPTAPLTVPAVSFFADTIPKTITPLHTASVSLDDTLVLVLLKIYDLIGDASTEGDDGLNRNTYQHLLTQIPAQCLNNLDVEQLKHWGYWSQSPYERSLQMGLNVKQCNKVITNVYVFLAQLFGPVAADEMLNTSVLHVQQTPTGKIHSPRLFL